MRSFKLMLAFTALLITSQCGGTSGSGGDTLSRPIRYNNVYKVRSALNSGTSVNQRDSSGNTLLHLACYYRGSTDVARLLIRRGANVHAVNNTGYTPLHLCALNGCRRTIEVLLAGGAKKDARDKSGLTPYDRAKWVKQNHVLGLLKP